jgi:hypothetical protein
LVVQESFDTEAGASDEGLGEGLVEGLNLSSSCSDVYMQNLPGVGLQEGTLLSLGISF